VDVWLAKVAPAAAKVVMYRTDKPRPFTAIALWTEYAQTKKDGALTAMWRKRGPGQLAKCAEALAFRRAFPIEIGGGAHVDVEMDYIDAEVVEQPKFVAPPSPPPGVPDVRLSPSAPAGTTPNFAPDTRTNVEKPKAGRLPKDKPAERPTTPPAESASSPGSAPQSTSSGSTTSPSPSPNSSKLDAAIRQVEDKRAAGDAAPMPADSSSENRSSSESAQTSTSETASGAESTEGDSLDRASFGPDEDPVDSTPAADPVAAKLEEYKAFLAGCKTQGEMQKGFPQWRVWTVEMSKAGDARFHKDGELTKLITKLWGERKSELPA
jgi:hypothetical protein